MKAKRALISLTVFLFVCYLSAIFDIKDTQGEHTHVESSITVDFLTTESEAFIDETEVAVIEPFSYEVNNEIIEDNSTQQELNQETIISESLSEASTDMSTEVSLAKEETVSGSSSDIQSTESPNASAGENSEAATGDTLKAAKVESFEAVEKPEEIKSLYSNIGISIADSYVNIREEASEDSTVLGKLYRDSAAEILDKNGDDWYYVESGSVKGYVKSEYIKTGIPDEELLDKYGVMKISVKVDGLNVRKEPDTESDKLTVVYMNETYPVLDLQDEWVKVDITDEREIGYVKRELTDLIATFKKAVSKEEEQELLQLQKEERLKKETEVKYRDEVDYSTEDLKLLACLVHAEAGDQTYEGKLAVANIVLNRMKSSKFPNTMKKVIYSPGQFTVASSGSLSKQLANYENFNSNSQQLSIKAAKAALQGANNVGSRLYFHSYKAAVRKGYDDKNDCVKLDDQLFW